KPYFEKNDFMRASTLFDEISRYFRGTERSETILNYLAKSYMGQKDYFTASEYYKTYVKTYPKGQYLIESRFMIGYCYYLESPDARLDQTATHDAINSFQEFLDIHPDSERVPEVNKLLEELKSKLAYKELLSARLYYNLGNYLGNNYLSAIVVAQNALKNYPTSEHREELSYIILQSKYQQAFQSVEEKKIEEKIEKKEKVVEEKTVFQSFEVEKAPECVNLSQVRSSMQYPEIAREAGMEGRVTVKVLVGPDGNVIKVGSVSGPDVFHDEVRSKANDLQFTPGLQNGKPVKVWVTVPFNFKLK
ncbi:MAG: outer membrane protein assembly factor BamD, partial [Ignavibacteria bacterium]|nr:outer membrane protein assembly factor BamD [Ignavibacteria bacterium]